jgi:uncharacterized protein YrzB (UPF0473 family)
MDFRSQRRRRRWELAEGMPVPDDFIMDASKFKEEDAKKLRDLRQAINYYEREIDIIDEIVNERLTAKLKELSDEDLMKERTLALENMGHASKEKAEIWDAIITEQREARENDPTLQPMAYGYYARRPNQNQ